MIKVEEEQLTRHIVKIREREKQLVSPRQVNEVIVSGSGKAEG